MHKSRASLTPKTSHHVFTSDVLARHGKVRDRQAAVQRSRDTSGQAIEKERQATATDAGRDRTNAEQSKGNPLHGHQLVERLKKLNSRFIFQPSVNTSGKTTGIYIADQTLGEDGLRYLGIAFQTEFNPEYDVISDEPETLGQVKERGWRTVVVRLIRERLISEPKADIVFGPPSRDSERWALGLGKRGTV